MSALLGQLLIEKGYIQHQDLEKALSIQGPVGGLLGAILIRIGALGEELLLNVLSKQLGFKIANKDILIPDAHDVFEFMDHSPIEFDWFLDQQVVLWQEDILFCCSRNPLAPFLQDTIRYFYREQTVEFCLIANQTLDSLIDYLKKEQSVESLFSHGEDTKALRELAEEAPVIELVNNIFSQAINSNSSDVHIEPGEENFMVRFRTDGVLYNHLRQPSERFAAVASRIKLISGLDIAERRLPQDGRITTRVSGKEMDVRVSTAPGVHGESIVMRLLPKDREEVHLEGLGMEPDHLQMMKELTRESHGIVLVTGPTGSGKSTTLYGALTHANDSHKKIITVEDPVEFKLNGITQIQAHAEIGYTFAKALRAILRQDPDIIMIGEIRDQETAEIAIQSAMTGHLVLSTLHTNDALSSFTRLIDMGVEPFLVAAPMKAVQAQRLVRRVCSHCAEPSEAPSDIAREFAKLNTGISAHWLTAKGCSKCQNTGYRGRMGIYELFPVTSEMRELIIKKESLTVIRALAIQQGHRTLYQDGLIKAARGKTTLEEVIRITSDFE